MSNSKLTLEQNDILKLTCSFCKKHLSVFPIFTSEDGKTYKCGRSGCSAITSNSPMQQNILYEIVGKYLLFPCSESTNCKKILPWEGVEEHERKCPHRTIFCPVSNCSEKFEIIAIEKHFQNNHPFDIQQQQTNIFDNILRIKGENIYLMTNNGNVFLYCRSTDKENMCFTVYELSSCTPTTFSVVFVSPTGSIQYTKKCSFPPYCEGYFTTWSLAVNKELLIGILDSNDDSVCQKIELKINTEEVKPNTPAGILTELQFEQALQANFKCCVCKKMLEYKTKVCRSGHSFCGSHQRGCTNDYYTPDTGINNFAYDNVYELCRAHLPAILNILPETEIVKKNEPRENFEALKCSFCDKYLSTGPIFISSDGKLNKCGRCVDLAPSETENPLLPNYIYEELAKHVQFPCSESSNCKEVLQWEEAGKHETTCPYRKISCPATNCTDKFEINTVLGHFQGCHEDNVVNNNIAQGIEIEVEIDKPQAILINSEGKYFIAYYNMTNKNISLSIQILMSSLNGTQYEFSLSCSSQTCCIKFRNNRPILIFGENLSDKQHHEIIINKSQLRQCLGLTETATSFKVHIHIYPYTPEFARSLCKALECPVCFRVMNSTIKLCSAGHSVCQNCTSQVQNCPTCRSGFSGSVNTPLQKMYTCFRQYIPDILNPNDLDC